MENERLTNEQVMLKTSLFGGFEKREVLSYIDKLREQNEKSVEQLEFQMNDMSSARTKLEQQIGSFEKTMAGLEQQLAQKSVKINELTTEVSSLKTALDQKEHALNVSKEQSRVLALKAQSFEYKAGRYDEMAEQVGDIIIEAKRSATEIVAAADVKAKEIEANAVSAAREATERLTGLRRDVVEMRQSMETLVATFNRRLNELDAVIEGVKIEDKPVDKMEEKPDDVAEPSEQRPSVCPSEFFRNAAKYGE